MKKAYDQSIRLSACVGIVDWLTFNVMLLIFYLSGIWFMQRYGNELIVDWLVFNISYLLARSIVHISLHKRSSSLATIMGNTFGATVITILCNAAILGMFHLSSPGFLRSLWMALLLYVVLTTERVVLQSVIKHLRFKGHDNIDAVIVGDVAAAKDVIMFMSDRWNGYHLIGIFSDNTETLCKNGDTSIEVQRLGAIDDVENWLETNDIDEIYICAKGKITGTNNRMIRCCTNKCVHVYYIPAGDITINKNIKYKELGSTYVIALYNEPLMSASARLVKRVFDICFSGAVLLLIFPIMFIIVAIVTKMTMPGPIFFRQKRTGYDGKEFTCYKFRSMKVNEEADKTQATLDDERVTKWGHILRHYNIDEFPQFYNVFIGDMSIVGPRPHMLAHTEYYSKAISEYMIRHYVRPGITGWAQTHGSRGETKTVDDMAVRVKKDIWYIEHWTFWLDIQIIIMTIGKLFNPDKKAY